MAPLKPGADEPGADEPGADEPGADEPGADEPGADEPGVAVNPTPDARSPGGQMPDGGTRIPDGHATLPFPEGAAGLIWYVSYGSNLLAARLRYYLVGGTPPGTPHHYPGCRDRSPPRLTVPVTMPGTVYFTSESKVWTGGLAFYDPDEPGETAARAYLLATSQFADIVAQEMHRMPGGDLDVASVVSTGRTQLGPGRYETLLLVGHLGGYPLLTFTAPWRAADVQLTPPSAAYLAMLAAGLRESHGWAAERVAAYLCALPGALGTWRREDVERLADGGLRCRPTGEDRPLCPG